MRWPPQNPGDPSMPRAGPVPAAASSSAAAFSEHPCVTLNEWWLARVEGHEWKIAVAGIFERNQSGLDFAAAPIAKRYEPYVLETDNGTVVFIYGLFNIRRTLENGFPIEVCEKFSLGFPHWWENWNELYPKILNSQTGSHPRSSRTRNSREDSSIFYLESLQIGKRLHSYCIALPNAEAFSGNGDAFPDSSCLPNGAPRFEECTSDDDSPTIGKSAASNRDSNKVGNIETYLIGASTLKERSHIGIDRNVPSASTGECSNDEGYGGIDNPSRINCGCQKTHVASMKRRGFLKKPQHVASSESVPSEDTQTSAYSDVQSLEKSVGLSRKQRFAIRKLQRATRSPNIRPIPYCSYISPLTRGWAKSLPLSTPESYELKITRTGRVVVPALDHGCQNIVNTPDGSVSAIVRLDSPPPLKVYARRKKAKGPLRTGLDPTTPPALKVYARRKKAKGSLRIVTGLEPTAPPPLKVYARRKKAKSSSLRIVSGLEPTVPPPLKVYARRKKTKGSLRIVTGLEPTK